MPDNFPRRKIPSHRWHGFRLSVMLLLGHSHSLHKEEQFFFATVEFLAQGDLIVTPFLVECMSVDTEMQIDFLQLANSFLQGFNHLGGTSHIAEIGCKHDLVELDILTFDERLRVNEKIGNDEVKGVVLRGICGDNDSREVNRNIINAAIERSKAG